MSKKRKKDNDIYIEFIGHSNTDVTGSSVLINYKKDKDSRSYILIELGLVQGENTIDKEISANRRMLENLPKDIIGNIEYVLLSHAHADHTCNLPYLNDDNGFKGEILGSEATIEITKDLIKDSVYIHSKNIESLKSKGKKVKPLYTEVQMNQMFKRMRSISIYEKIKLNEAVTIELVNSGHVYGATMIHLWIKKPNNSIKHIVYTGDMGSDYNNEYQPFVQKREQIDKCNLLISEATYNNPNRSFNNKEAKRERKELLEIIKNGLLNNKRILIPIFSFGRCQSVYQWLYEELKNEEWFKPYCIVMDGKLMFDVNNDYLKTLSEKDREYFTQILNWDKLKKNKTYDSTLATLSQRIPGIYLVSSGFMQSGRVVTYLQQFLNCSKDIICCLGHCGGEGSIGYKILDSEQKTVTIDKRVILKRAETHKFSSFSSHIQFDELIKLFKGVNADKIIIHHSSEKDKSEFGQIVREELKQIGKTTKVEVVTKNNNVFIL